MNRMRYLVVMAAGLVCWAGIGGRADAQAPATRLPVPPPAPTTTYKMSNGMDVILKENHSSPMIASVVFVRSGSKYETAFNNGVTHFLEHLLFDGTATRTQEQISNRIRNLGGYINAFTRKELTAYMSLVPAEYIGEALDIQQDMLFNSIFPADRFPKERKIVIEEIRKDTDNPDYIAETFHARWVYRGSPYARPVLGYENLIATIPREQVIDYYHTYYQPNNMIIMVIGDFETRDMTALLDDTFGRHPAQPIPPRPTITVPPVNGRTVKRMEADVPETRIDIHFRLPKFTDPSYYPLTVLSDVLGERSLSPLQKELTQGDNPPATDVSVSLETQAEFSALEVSVTATDTARTDDILSTVARVMHNLPSLDVSPEDLQGLITRLRVHDIFLREKLHYYAIMKAPMLVTTGYEFMDALPSRLEQVTLAQIRDAAAEYLTGENYIATVLTPKTPSVNEAAARANPGRTTYTKRILSNGLTAIVKSNPDSRVFAVNILGKNRAACEPDSLVGISDFVNRMLTSGTESRDADRISRELTAMGADLTTNDNPYIPYDDRYTTPQYTFIKFATIDEYAAKGLALLSDMLDHSVFPEEEITKTRKQVGGLLGMASSSTRQAVRDLFYRSLFGDGPYARPIMGTRETVMRMTAEALKQHLHRLYAPKNMILTCATNLDTEQAFALLDSTMGRISPGTPPSVTVPMPAAPHGEMASHRPMEKEQVYILLGGLLPGASTPDGPAIRVAGRILSSRLAAELREKQGLAYSVGASVRFDRDFGWYVCSMGTGKANYAAAKEGIVQQLRRLQEELPDSAEVETAQNAIWGSVLMSQLSRVTQTYYMGVDEFLGLGYDYTARMVDGIRAVRSADIQRVARRYFDPDNYILATVGSVE